MQSLLLASADGDVERVKQVLDKWDHSNHNINETDTVRFNFPSKSTLVEASFPSCFSPAYDCHWFVEYILCCFFYLAW